MRITTEAELNKLLKAPLTANLWLLYGEEDYLKLRYRNLLVSLLMPPEAREIDYAEYDMPFLSNDTLEAELPFLPFVAERRVAVITGFDTDLLDADTAEQLFGILDNLPDTAVLILVSAGGNAMTGPRNKKAEALVAEKGISVCLKARDRSDLLRFVQTELGKYKATADSRVCYHLIDLCRQDMLRLSNECAKLGAYAAGGVLTADAVDELVSLTAEENVFSMVRNVIGRRNQIAVRQLNNLLTAGTTPLFIIACIVGSYVDIQRAAAAQRSNVTLQQAQTDYGYPKKTRFRLENAWQTASKLRDGYAADCLALALKADLDCKSQSSGNELTLVKLLADLSCVRR